MHLHRLPKDIQLAKYDGYPLPLTYAKPQIPPPLTPVKPKHHLKQPRVY